MGRSARRASFSREEAWSKVFSAQGDCKRLADILKPLNCPEADNLVVALERQLDQISAELSKFRAE